MSPVNQSNSFSRLVSSGRDLPLFDSSSHTRGSRSTHSPSMGLMCDNEPPWRIISVTARLLFYAFVVGKTTAKVTWELQTYKSISETVVISCFSFRFYGSIRHFSFITAPLRCELVTATSPTFEILILKSHKNSITVKMTLFVSLLTPRYFHYCSLFAVPSVNCPVWQDVDCCGKENCAFGNKPLPKKQPFTELWTSEVGSKHYDGDPYDLYIYKLVIVASLPSNDFRCSTSACLPFVHFHRIAHAAAPAEVHQHLNFSGFCSLVARNPPHIPDKCKTRWIWGTIYSMTRKNPLSATRRTSLTILKTRVSGSRKEAGFLACC